MRVCWEGGGGASDAKSCRNFGGVKRKAATDMKVYSNMNITERGATGEKERGATILERGSNVTESKYCNIDELLRCQL